MTDQPDAIPLRVLKDTCIPAAWAATRFTASLPLLRSHLLQPAMTPSLLVSIISQMPERQYLPDGLQVLDTRGALRYYANCEHSALIAPNSSAWHGIMTLTLPDALDGGFTVVYADGRGGHWPLGHGLKVGRARWTYTPEPVVPEQSALKASPRRLFVCGAPKSGTTWVENMLNAHPDVLCLGEGHFASVSEPSSENPLLHADFLKWFAPHATHRYFRCFTFRAIALSCFSEMETCWNGSVIGDRTPQNVRHLSLLRLAFPDAQIIVAVRHPLDVAVSRAYHEWNLFRSGHLDLCTLPMDHVHHLAKVMESRTHPPLGALFDATGLLEWLIDEWAADNAPLVHYATDEHVHLVKYETMIDAPIESACQLLRFLSVRTDEAISDYCAQSASFERQSHGRQRGQEDILSFFRKGVVGDFRNHLSRPQIDAANSHLTGVAGRLLRLLGYAP